MKKVPLLFVALLCLSSCSCHWNGRTITVTPFGGRQHERNMTEVRALSREALPDSLISFFPALSENGRALFEFFADNTNVEWGHFLIGIAGDNGLNSIATSHQEDSNAASADRYNTRYIYGYTIREYNHSHPKNTSYPSNKDTDFARKIEQRANRRWMVPDPLGEKYRGINLCDRDPCTTLRGS